MVFPFLSLSPLFPLRQPYTTRFLSIAGHFLPPRYSTPLHNLLRVNILWPFCRFLSLSFSLSTSPFACSFIFCSCFPPSFPPFHPFTNPTHLFYYSDSLLFSLPLLSLSYSFIYPSPLLSITSFRFLFPFLVRIIPTLTCLLLSSFFNTCLASLSTLRILPPYLFPHLSLPLFSV